MGRLGVAVDGADLSRPSTDVDAPDSARTRSREADPVPKVMGSDWDLGSDGQSRVRAAHRVSDAEDALDLLAAWALNERAAWPFDGLSRAELPHSLEDLAK